MTMRDPGAFTSRGIRYFGLPRGTELAALVVCLALGVPGPVRTVQAQALPHAAANQLHAAIVNGDVEALEYWLSARHADPNAATDQEASVTPLARCLALAGRVLDEPAGEGKSSTEPATAPAGTVLSLRVVQEMITVLHEHGARLGDADRARVSGPVLRWYEDAVPRPAPGATPAPSPVPTPVPAAPSPSSVEPAPAATASTSAPPAAPTAPATTSTAPTPTTSPLPAPRAKASPVTIAPDQRKTCNGSGHRVYLLNTTVMPIAATVTTYKDAGGGPSPVPQTNTYNVEPGNGWELGCDRSRDGGAVRYVLNAWK